MHARGSYEYGWNKTTQRLKISQGHTDPYTTFKKKKIGKPGCILNGIQRGFVESVF